MTDTPDNSEASQALIKDEHFASCIERGDQSVAAGDFDQARLFYKKARRIKPDTGLPYYKLGTIHHLEGNNDKAIKVLKTALNFDPQNTGILNTLGAAYGQSGKPSQALKRFRKVFELDPTHAVAATNCGRLLFSNGRMDAAEAWLAAAAKLRPDHVETLCLLTEARLALGQPRLAVSSGRLAVKADTENVDARLAYGQALLSVRKLKAAHEQLSLVLRQTPDHPEGLYFLAEAEEKLGRIEQARELYNRVIELDIAPDVRTLLRLKKALALPVINESTAIIETDRGKISAALDSLPREPVADPYASGGFTNFYLAYQGENDRDIQRRIAAFYLECCPDLASVAPHIGKAPTRKKFRIGVLSSFLRNHTVGYLCRGLIEHLDRDRFEVVLLRSPVLPVEDPVAPLLAAMADQVVDLPDDLNKARTEVAKIEADLLYFPEIGMEDLVYFLAFARSAPVQVMGWGHPVTSGIPNMDAFLSVADMEPESSGEHYNETLIKLESLSICVPTPSVDGSHRDRSVFGMDPDAPAYLCAQSLYKIHPDFDTISAALLERDPEARLYFMALNTDADDVFQHRLEKRVGTNMQRVKMLPRVPGKDFTSLLSSADVLLDVPQWSGGKTSLESLATGTPIVHWPGEFMRGRHTLAFYRKVDVLDCVADSAESYVERAYRLVHDKKFRTSVRKRIKERAPTLFNDTSAIAEISDVFERLILERR